MSVSRSVMNSISYIKNKANTSFFSMSKFLSACQLTRAMILFKTNKLSKHGSMEMQMAISLLQEIIHQLTQEISGNLGYRSYNLT